VAEYGAGLGLVHGNNYEARGQPVQEDFSRQESGKFNPSRQRRLARAAGSILLAESTGMAELTLNINGSEQRVRAADDEPLLWVLRNRLGLTGTKFGCGEGQCGACTVLLNGRATRSCLTPASAAAGAKIVTIEGLERNGTLSPVQQAFLEEGAYQCGYCTSGMIMAATALLQEHPHPSGDQILEAMNGNICRCGTYPRILAAIRRASGEAPGKETENV
jgi:aerobic-type carbon monoxide dehydrogenase small subunit (CoxS/CutS family)